LLELRQLDDGDFSALVSLLQEQRAFFGVDVKLFPQLTAKPTLDKLMLNLLLKGNERIIGAFERDVLQGAVLLRLLPESSLWVIRLVIVREALKGLGSGVHVALLEAAITLAEAEGLFRHLAVVPAKHVSKAGSWMASPKRAAYLGRNLLTVPAGELPQDEQLRKLLYDLKPYPIDSVVREFVLPLSAA
jgi:GNAT superfamily N-acetyltransferase